MVHILKALLKDGIFESELRAREEFPDLFLTLSSSYKSCCVEQCGQPDTTIEARGKRMLSLEKAVETGSEEGNDDREFRGGDILSSMP